MNGGGGGRFTNRPYGTMRGEAGRRPFESVRAGGGFAGAANGVPYGVTHPEGRRRP